MPTFFGKCKIYIKKHKIITAIVVILLAVGAYYTYQANTTTTTVTKYVVQNATTGSVIASVSGTGQVQAGTTINVAAKVSETVTRVPVKVGQHVAAGQLLVQMDPTTEERAVKQAQLSLQQAQLSLQELQQVSTTTLLQEQDAVTTAEQSVVNASTTLAQDYQSGFGNLGPTFVNLQTVMTGLQNFVQGNDITKAQSDPDAFVSLMPNYLQPGVIPYKDTLQAEYVAATAAYQKNLTDYHAITSDSSPAAMDAMFAETYGTAQTVSDAVKAGKDFLNYVIDSYPTESSSTKPLPTVVTTLQNSFSTYTATMSSAETGVQSTITNIASDRNNIINTQNSLRQASETLNELLAGPTQTTLLSQQISVQSAQNNLTTAQQNLDYTSITAPISGVVSAIGATIGEASGTSPVTIVGDGQVAQVTLNEIDAAKVAVGDKATLTFSALSTLSLAGTVVEIDPVGTVSQGVVSYNVQVGFSQPADTTSSMQVKPGMSVTADIVTQADQNVIAVPNAALVTSNGASYILEPATPLSAAELASSTGGIELASTKRVQVTTGLVNSTMTEITSGVSVGDQIIVQTIKSTSAKSTTATASGGTSALQLLSGAGGARPTGGAGRVGG